MTQVLFVESGGSGGGSFESLYQHLRVIDRGRIRPLVACLNDGRYVGLIRGLDIPVYVLTDLVYSRHAPRYQRKAAYWLRRAALRVSRHLPAFYLRALRWVHKPLVHSLVRLIRETNVDIVHLNVHVYRDLFGLFAAEKAAVPCISHLRSADPRTRGEFNAHMARYANRVVAGYIANSAMTQAYWGEQGLDPHKMSLVHNGIPSDEVEPMDVWREFGIEAGARVLGCVAPLRNRLKVDESLIRGFARLLKRSPRTVLLVVGEGPMRAVLAEEARALGVCGQVRFVGFQDRAKEIIAGVDVSLVINGHDSFSRVVLETMQAGTALVATDVGGIREIVRNKENGILVPYGDDDAFAGAVGRLLADAQLRERLVGEGRRTVRDEFSIEHYATRIERIYGSLVGVQASQEARVGVEP